MDFIYKILSERTSLSESSKKKFIELLTLKEYPKGAVISKVGEVPTTFYLIKNGNVRSYVTTDKNKEFIRTIYVPGTTTGSFSALILQKPSRSTYDCLTCCEIYEGDFSEFKKLCKENIEIANLYNMVLEQVYLRMEKRIYELSVLDATQRYLKLKKTIPNIDNIIPQYHIASYLNITPVQLSRIRKELYSK